MTNPRAGWNTTTPTRTRAARLREYGLLGVERDQELNAYAQDMVKAFGAQAAVVNLFDEHHQNFVGIHMKEGDTSALVKMPKNAGWCPHTMKREVAFPLENVADHPRFFVGNVLVESMAVESYLGMALRDRDGTALGTVCVVDTEQRKWDVPLIKDFANRVMQSIQQRGPRGEAQR
ncbi:GAF domain-containing protein [Saccharopolyspora indica]|uniref:GAF domain-containing protein n=1 Tax=Saccharopolyspora indica TaxID=1229659 RepID=UPI0022EA7A9E|nr:GAF domain-containing protein [Saccharopolyspora indica]MDA3646839.1 GAF domain-containing protein [Saccharopolyspora indica]